MHPIVIGTIIIGAVIFLFVLYKQYKKGKKK